MILNLLRRHKDTKKRVPVKKPSHPAFPMHEISTFAHHTPFAVRDYRIKKGTAYIIMMNFTLIPQHYYKYNFLST